MPNTIPPPPSGSIVYQDPLSQAQPQQSGAIPPPPSGSIVYAQQPQQSQPDEPQNGDVFTVNDDDSTLTKAAKTVGNVGLGTLQGFGQGALATAAFANDVLDKLTFQDKGAVDQWLHQNAEARPNGEGIPQHLGQAAEFLSEFLTGEGELKGLKLSERLKTIGSIADLIEKYPQAVNKIGTALRVGTVGATVGAAHGGAEGAIIGGLTGGAMGGASATREDFTQSRADANARATQGMEPWDLDNPVEVESHRQAAKSGLSEGTGLATVPDLEAVENSLRSNYHQDVRNIAEETVRDALDKQTPEQIQRTMQRGFNRLNAPDEPAREVSLGIPEGVTPSPNEFAKAPTGTAPVDEPQEFVYKQPDSLRDVFGQPARMTLQSAQEDFQALDDASGGRWQRFNDEIANVAEKMADVAGIDDEQYGALDAKRTQLEQQQQKMVDQMKADGQVDPAIADRANNTYKQAMALQDVSKATQMSVDREVVQGVGVRERLNPDKFSSRLAKLDDVPLNGGQSRLEQALGEDRAERLRSLTDSYRTAGDLDLYKPTSETGQVALRSLIRDNVRTSLNPLTRKNAVVTDWNGVLRDFDALGADKRQAMFGADEVPKARLYIQKKAFIQRSIPTILKHLVGTSASIETVLALNHLVSYVMHPDDNSGGDDSLDK